MTQTYCLYFKHINAITTRYIQEHFLVYSWLEFPMFIEIIIKRSQGYSKFDIIMKLLLSNCLIPFELFEIDNRFNNYIYPSCTTNTKCIRMYTINK